MSLTERYQRLPLDQIVVKRDDRQRRQIFDDKGNFINSDNLLESIAEHGVMQPILIDENNVLIFGERRYTASKVNNLPDIPVRYIENLTEADAQTLELEENLRRTELPWRDMVRTVAKLHEIYKAADPKWSQKDTSVALSCGYLGEILRVIKDIDNPKISECTTIKQAYNVLQRQDDRALGDALSDIIEAGASIIKPTDGSAPTQQVNHKGEIQPISAPMVPTVKAAEDSILNLDFCEWAAAYSGPKFNFIHCDFPYGRRTFDGNMSGRQVWEHYDDDPTVYDKLIRALCANLDRIMSHQAHLMFWCAADITIQYETKRLFASLAPSLIFDEYPLVWHKTDNVGILPDPKRGPRRVTETALLASREDRLIVKSVSNAYGAPTDKSNHPSAKPEPVLRYFMSMFVDENTKMLDPTCGGGSSLRAAESLGAPIVQGLELNPEHCENARKALRQFRVLRLGSKVVT